MSPRTNAAVVGAMESNEDISPSMPSVHGRPSPDAASSLAAEAGRAAEGGADVTQIELSASRYPQSVAHIQDAQAAGQSTTLTIDRAGLPRGGRSR